jgi:hypothetical protein
MYRLIVKLILIFMAGVIFSCGSSNSDISLKSGDILFTGPAQSEAGKLSSAIDEVTQTHQNTNYTHMGIVEVAEQEVFVIHADPKNGVCRQPLNQFLVNHPFVDVYRLKGTFEHHIPQAIEKGNFLLGLPYDEAYIIGGNRHYCSGLIYTLFDNDSIFTLEPMTFIDPSTGDFHTLWVEHYDRLGIEIPEGLPGCNPNGMAVSDAIYFLGSLKQ